MLEAICQLQWLPSGGYSATEDGPPIGAGAGCVANSKEHEQIKKSQPWFCQTEETCATSSPKQETYQADILQGANEHIQVLSDVFREARDSDTKSRSPNYNNTSEPHIPLAGNLSRNIAQHASCTVGLKNEEERPGADGGSGESAHTCHQCVMSTTGVISPTKSLDRFLKVEVLSHRLPQV